MNTIVIEKRSFGLSISQEQILDKIAAMAGELDNAYTSDDPPVILVVLNGAFRFGADLVNAMQLPVDIGFVGVRSYDGMEGSQAKLSMELTENMRDRHVVVTEDIVDSGRTVDFIRALPGLQSVKSLKVASLLFKPQAFKGKEPPEYVGFEIGNAFVVGYGLDYNGRGRSLNHIYQLI